MSVDQTICRQRFDKKMNNLLQNEMVNNIHFFVGVINTENKTRVQFGNPLRTKKQYP
jgi:hypothetical protein